MDKKIKITKELVIDIYKRKFIIENLLFDICSLIIVIAFILWYDDLIRFFDNNLSAILKVIGNIVFILPLAVLIFLISYIDQAVELIRVLKGKFYICKDQVIGRTKRVRTNNFIGRGLIRSLEFKTY